MSGISEENRQPDTKIRFIDLTPQRMKCAYAAACPSVYRLDDGKLEITGEYVRIIPGISGHDEATIRIDLDLLENVFCQASDVQTGNGESLRDRAVVNEALDGSSPSGLPSLSQEYLERVSASISQMVIEWVDGCDFPEGDWRPGLPLLIKRRLSRFLAPSERDQSPKGGALLGSVHAGPVSEGNSPNTPQEAHSASLAGEDVSPAVPQPQDG